MSEVNGRKVNYFRRLYIAYLISTGTNTVAGLLNETELPRRTLQDTLKSLSDFEIIIESKGGTKNHSYSLTNWGPIDSKWIQSNNEYIKRIALPERK
ncbi:winged helix-turn-helix domain-containing protein [Pseudoalteromonas sp. OFAV1]|uniref:helix-turn-helix domain-containing protein n=1 Tax=Pseudoalteromonas sp. OFAV1 TaxID=2908892 RepID=UPI001F223AF1|nr:helix-turn-helix domain-containing protein [Pseudoalteromonas sp. OFAV1]MCF2902491.1 winged helix-turn-helix domain-containing protein [Pseudoalteromonas sp. OFAV1]